MAAGACELGLGAKSPRANRCIAARKISFSGKRCWWRIRTSKAGSTPVSFQGRLFMKTILMTAAMFSALALSPASAAMMKCTSDNMMKSTMMMNSMQDGPGKTAMGKEIGMANSDMSKGNMRGGCKHYMMAQKAAMMK
jgi:hypothetical protein